jgi:hypothetical protein
MMVVVITAAGWMAAALMLYAFWAVSRGRISGGGRQFQWCNVLGGLGLSASALYSGAMPSAALNIIWIGVGLASLARLRRQSGSGETVAAKSGVSDPSSFATAP